MLDPASCRSHRSSLRHNPHEARFCKSFTSVIKRFSTETLQNHTSSSAGAQPWRSHTFTAAVVRSRRTNRANSQKRKQKQNKTKGRSTFQFAFLDLTKSTFLYQKSSSQPRPHRRFSTELHENSTHRSTGRLFPSRVCSAWVYLQEIA